jgi:hypothetical protein
VSHTVSQNIHAKGDGYARRIDLSPLWQVGVQLQKPYTHGGHHN